MEKRIDCACEKCVGACKQTPGWFLPGEAEKAAEHLGIPFDEFKKKLIKDHASNPRAPDAPYIYSPRKSCDDAHEVRFIGSQRAHGACVFLIDNKCSIHAVKPYECSVIKACDYQHHGIRDKIEESWIEAGAPLGMRPDY